MSWFAILVVVAAVWHVFGKVLREALLEVLTLRVVLPEQRLTEDQKRLIAPPKPDPYADWDEEFEAATGVRPRDRL